MKIAVLGSVTQDTLVYLNRPTLRNLGGSLYNVIALASLTHHTICPVANVGEDIFDEVVSILSEYPNVILDGLKRVKQSNIHCYLFFPSEATVYATLFEQGEVVPIRFKQAEPFLDSSLILITFPTGFDLSLRTLRLISAKAACPIYLDYHILTHGRDRIGTCFLKKRHNWLDWVSAADFVQFNRFEAKHVWGKRIDIQEEALSLGKVIINRGVRAVIITLGEEGSKAIYRDGKDVVCKHIEAEPVPQVVDATGCGCVYTAGFISHYLRLGSILAACKFANHVAGKKCMVSGITNLKEAFEFLAAQGYRDGVVQWQSRDDWREVRT